MAETGKYGLLGERLGHSFSPAIHAQLADYEYLLYEKRPEELEAFLTAGAFDGLNVTIPYKKAVIPHCRALTPAARRIGSVNTLLRQPDGSLLGDNTDYDGFAYLLRRAGVRAAGKKALVLGSGGAGLTVRTVLADLGAREVVTISRSGAHTYQNLERHADAQLLVNATPVGMYPDNGRTPVDLARLPGLEGVFDLIYNPARTQLLLDGARRGLKWSNGLGMLVAQAKAAAERFLGRSIPDGRVDEITAQMQRQTQNLILVGMPGCGKTTVGRELARRLDRPFVDLDQLIEQRAGCTIPQMFQQQGEAAFRALEHQVLRDVAKGSGQVIATGGGVVTREENRDPMVQNGTVIWLRRDLEQLPTDGRPVSQSVDLNELYRRRAPLYLDWSDLAVDNLTPQGAATEIIGRLNL